MLSEFLDENPQDRAACGNYHLGMAEMILVHGEGGMLSRPQSKPESGAGACEGREVARATRMAPQPVGLGLDWAAKLAEHDRWLRTIVLARLGERQAVDEVMQEVALAAVAQRAPSATWPDLAPGSIGWRCGKPCFIGGDTEDSGNSLALLQ